MLPSSNLPFSSSVVNSAAQLIQTLCCVCVHYLHAMPGMFDLLLTDL